MFSFPRNERHGYTHAHDALCKQTRRRRWGWEERGEDNKKLRLLLRSPAQGSDRAALGGAPIRLQTKLEPFQITERRTSRRYVSLLAANPTDSLGLRSEPPQLFGRHFSDKMADTPLPPRCALSARFLSITPGSVMLCAVCPAQVTAETFPRVSVPSSKSTTSSILTFSR